MKKPTISIIAAISDNLVLGKDNKLIWHIPEDMKRVRQLTLGHPLIMGRKTFESIGKPLPKRTNIIITRDQNYHVDGAIIVHSLEQGIQKASEIDNNEIFIFGGAEIYRQSLQYVDRLYLTVVHLQAEGDAFFPKYSDFNKIIFQEDHLSDKPPYTFITLEKN